jgi:atypical dual specificity phosphatase
MKSQILSIVSHHISNKMYGENNFKWIIKNKVAGSHSPSVEELRLYKELGFTAIVSLQENIEKKPVWDKVLPYYDIIRYTEKDARDVGLEFLHIPVYDMKPPTVEQYKQFFNFAKDHIVVVHCYAGIGRTGCILGSYIGLEFNLSGEDAVKKLREIWPVYIQTDEQRKSVVDFINFMRSH